MRVLVLCVDGAEYTIIKDHPELEGFRQKEYGFHSIPHLSTSILFPSFLYGLEPEDMVVRSKLKRLANRLGRRFLKRNIFKFRGRNIFQSVKNSIGIDVPSYTPGKMCSNKISLDMEKYGREYLEKAVRKEFEETLAKVGEAMVKPYSLIIAHFGILDLYQHYANVYTLDEILEQYYFLDKTLKRLEDKFDGIVFVLSDHGLVKGIHQPYGFYSCSEKLDLKGKIRDLSWTDYRHIFECLVSDSPIPERQVPWKTKDWKLLKTLNLLQKVAGEGLYIRRRDPLRDRDGLEYMVLRDILFKFFPDRLMPDGYEVDTVKWSDGGKSYMAHQITGRKVNPLIHWKDEDVVSYARRNGLIRW